MRQRLIWLAIVFGAAFFIVAFFVGDETRAGQALHLTGIRTGLSNVISVVTTMAIGLGVINLFWVHGGNIVRRKKEWPFSIVVFVTFSIVMVFLVWQYRLDAEARALETEAKGALEAYRAAFQISDPGARDRVLRALPPDVVALANRYYEQQATYRFQPLAFYMANFINPLVATVMALLGFYITYAAYRAFRIRSAEATVMMISAVIVVLGSDPVGGWLSLQFNALCGASILDLPCWADLDNRVLNSGMQRGLGVGIAVAIISVSLRILLGLERGLTQVSPGTG